MSVDRPRILLLVYSPTYLRADYARGCSAGEKRFLGESPVAFCYTVDTHTTVGQRVADRLERMGRSVTRVSAGEHLGWSRVAWWKSLFDEVDRVQVLELDPYPLPWVELLRKEARTMSKKFRGIRLWK